MNTSGDSLLAKEKQLEKSIIRKRKDLVNATRTYGFSHSETLMISREIDRYIFEFQLIKKQKQK